MSTSPDLINVLSRWLAGHVSDEELRQVAAEDERADDLRQALASGAARSDLDRLVRETLEELALG